ncbi:hypothetical protein [Streptomyces avermitilis]
MNTGELVEVAYVAERRVLKAKLQVVGVISDFRSVHNIPHRVSCRAVGMSESWFYKHRTRKPTTRQTRHLRLVTRLLGRPQQGADCIGRSPRFVEIDTQ